MTVHLFFKQERPTAVQLRLSPVAEALAGLRFAQTCLLGHDGDGSDHSGVSEVVHHTGADRCAHPNVAAADTGCLATTRRPQRSDPLRVSIRVVRRVAAARAAADRPPRPRPIARSDWTSAR